MAEDKLSIGEILQKAREEQDLTLEEVSLATKIKEKYLAAIEADNWPALPSSVQQKGFTRAYADYLKLDSRPLLKKLRELLQEPDQESHQPPQDPREEASQPRLLGEIGAILKDQREKLGYSIANVEGQIFIPGRYLEAIENGSLEELPSTVQGKGMVKNYAQFLGLDPDPLLLNYADALRSRLEKTRPDQTRGKSRSPLLVWLKRFLANPTLLWAGVVMLIAAVSIWAGLLIIGGNGSALDDTATVPAVADILLPTGTPSATVPATEDPSQVTALPPTPTLEGEEQEATPTPVLTGNEKIQLQLNILQRTWVRVTIDNIVAFEGRLIPGSVKVFGGEVKIEVLTGNAGGIEVIYNQQNLGVMGLYGQVISRVYTPQGVATPTPTITLTPTPSDTPEPSLTPTPTDEPQ